MSTIFWSILRVAWPYLAILALAAGLYGYVDHYFSSAQRAIDDKHYAPLIAKQKKRADDAEKDLATAKQTIHDDGDRFNEIESKLAADQARIDDATAQLHKAQAASASAANAQARSYAQWKSRFLNELKTNPSESAAACFYSDKDY